MTASSADFGGGSRLVAIAGPIGAGKSTLLNGLVGAIGAQVGEERVDANPFFERFLAAPAEWCFRSQLAFMLGSVENAIDARSQVGITVVERSIHEQLEVFCTEQLGAGLLDGDEFDQLRRLVMVGERLGATPDVLVVLEAPLDQLAGRIRARDRPGEDTYDEAYLARLYRRYLAWRRGWTRSPVVDVDVARIDVRTPAGLRGVVREVVAALGH